ncbi:MAG: tetratricopeptide repeat protein [Candidatus Auribacterota bacterium]|nr:tetratricopeptide repeat protein [Candidatus Auribacterota bacterium]
MINLRRAGIILLFALPFLVRLAYFIDTKDDLYVNTPILISYVNHNLASDLANRQGAPYTLFKPPYYPLLVSFVYRIFGVNPLFIKLIQWALGGLGCWVLYFLAKLYYGRRQAVTALLISSLYVPSVFFEGELIEHPVASVFALLCVAIIACAGRLNNRFAPVILHLCAGAMFGLAFLVRPDILIGFPFLLAAICMAPAPAGQRVKILAGFLCVTAVFLFLLLRPQTLMPVGENYIASNAAINFFLGSNEKADGYNPYTEEVMELPADHPEAKKYHIDGLTLAMILYARPQTDGALSSVAPYWNERAFGFIRSRTGRYILLEFKKLLLFFNGFIITNQKDIYYMRRFSFTLKTLLFNFWFLCFPLGLIIPLAVVGVIGERTAYRRILLGAIPMSCLATVLIFFHCSRFSHPAVPFFILFASNGLTVFWEYLKSRRILAVAGVITIFFAVNADLFDTHKIRSAQESFNAGSTYLTKNQPDIAEKYFMDSIRYDHTFEPAVTALCSLYELIGRPDKTISFLTETLPPDSAKPQAVMYGMAGAYLNKRDMSNATLWAENLLDKYPEKPDNYILLYSVYMETGKEDDALAVLRRGAQKFPYYSPINIRYGIVLAESGQYEQALDVFEKILSYTTHYPEAYYYAAFCFASSKQFENAKQILLYGLRHNPSDIPLMFLLAYVFEQTKHTDSALEIYSQIISLQPQNGDAYYHTARLLAQLERYHDAVPMARTALQFGHPQAQGLADYIGSRINPSIR